MGILAIEVILHPYYILLIRRKSRIGMLPDLRDDSPVAQSDQPVALALPPDVFRIDQLATPIPAGHKLGNLRQFFPGSAQTSPSSPPPAT